jgi:hypothetical protein
MSLPILATALLLAVPAPDTPPAAFERAEVQRIQAHFDGALDMLAARDLSALTPSQRQRRSALVAVLRVYRDGGAFPRNYDFPGEAVPYFIDRKTGIRCAVAHLLEHTGEIDLVARVARADNNIWVAELEGDAEFGEWLDANGLTLAEAARIQVPYVGDDPPPVIDDVREARVGPTSGQSALAIGTALTATAFNTFLSPARPTRAGIVIGALSGAFAVGTGASALQPGGDRNIGTASIVAGSVGIYVASRAFGRLRQQNRAASAAASAAANAAVAPETLSQRTSLAPIIPLSPSQGFGASISLRF